MAGLTTARHPIRCALGAARTLTLALIMTAQGLGPSGVQLVMMQ